MDSAGSMPLNALTHGCRSKHTQAGLTGAACASLLGAVLVIIVISTHLHRGAAGKDPNRFLLSLFVFDLFFCTSELQVCTSTSTSTSLQ